MYMRTLFKIFCFGLWAVQSLAQTVRTSEPLIGDAFFSPDGKHLISTSGQVFDLRNGRSAADLNYCGTGQNGDPTIFEAGWSGRGSYVLFNRRIFDGENLAERFVFEEKRSPKRHYAAHEKHFSKLKPLDIAAFSDDETQVLAGDEVFDIATQKSVATLKPNAYKSGMAYLHFINRFYYNKGFINVEIKSDFQSNYTHVPSPDLKYYVSGESMKNANFAFFKISSFRVYETYYAQQNRAEHTYQLVVNDKIGEDKKQQGDFSDSGLEFSENSLFAALRDGNSVKVYELEKGKSIFTAEGTKNVYISGFDLSPSGNLLLVFSEREAVVYDVQKKKKIYTLFDDKNPDNSQWLNSPFISPNEKYVINGSNGTVIDITNGNTLGVMMGADEVRNESATLNKHNQTAVFQYSDGSSRIFDTSTGNELFVSTIQNLNTLLFAAAPNGKWAAASDWDGKLTLWNTANPSVPLTQFTPHEGKLITQILFDTLQNNLIVNAMDGTVKAFSLKDFSMVRSFVTAQKSNRLLLCGKDILAIRGDEVSVYQQDGTLVGGLVLNEKPKNISVYPQAQLLYTQRWLYNYYLRTKIRGFNVKRGKDGISYDKNKMLGGTAASPHKLYTVSSLQRVSEWNLENGKVAEVVFRNENPDVKKDFFDYALSLPTYGKVLGYGNGAYLDFGQKTYKFPFGGINKVLFESSPTYIGKDCFVSNDGSKVAVLNNKNKAKIWNATLYDNTQGKVIGELKLPKDYIMDFSAVFSHTGDSLFALLRSDGYSLGVFETKKGAFLKEIRLPFEGKNLLVSPRGDWILACKEKDFVFFDSKSHTVLWEGKLPLSHYTYQLSASADGRYVALRNFSDHKGSPTCVLDLKNKTEKLVEDLAFFSNFTADSRYMVTTMKDTKADIDYLTFYALPELSEKKLSALQMGIGDKSVIFTPDRYYMASKASIQDVHFAIGKNAYSFDQFDLRFNRPDIVLARLGYANKEMLGAYKKAWEKRVRKAGFDPKLFDGQQIRINAPEVRLEKAIPLTTTAPSLSVAFSATDKEQPISRVHIYHNGVPIFGRAGADVSKNNQKAGKANTVSVAESVALTVGRNVLEFSAINAQGIESVRERQEITYKPASPTKPNLYVVAIGVSEFADKTMNLTYAAKDADDLSALLRTKTDVYGTVNIQTLTNAQATKAEILKTKTALLQTKPDDEVIVFVASHGLLDDNLDYYIATTDVDFGNPSAKGLAYEELENLLDNIPSRNKLLLIDACHSGEVDKEAGSGKLKEMESGKLKTENGAVAARGFKKQPKASDLGLTNSFELMKELFADLRRGNGAVVISSASGEEFAFESEAWKNGVFTYAVLEGLKSGNADLDKNKAVSVSELRDYVSRRVTELTEGKQNPTSRTENLENDFRVW
jgi:WD40 repeat protein/uncharacterized caspase-like protein